VQVAAAKVAQTAVRMGLGMVVIEDYGGIGPAEDVHVRRVLERFPLRDLKMAIVNACETAGLTVQECASAFISSTCPACENADTRQHNVRTDIFHCRECTFERPADWVATYWMMRHAKVDTTLIDGHFRKQIELEKRLSAGPKDSSATEQLGAAE
jgi:transposase